MGGCMHGSKRKAVLVALLASVLFGAFVVQAFAASGRAKIAEELGYSLTPSKTKPYVVCPPAGKGAEECMSIAVPRRAAVESAEANSLFGEGEAPSFVPDYEGSGEEGGFAPSDLKSAYKLPATGGSGQTVALIDAYDDPEAEANLKTYRSHYGLSECTKANGCFKKVNQLGETEPKEWPKNSSSWGLEISLDLDMVSAVCPECHILLVEATTNETVNLDAAEEEAVKLKATEISNSWGSEESSEETKDDKYFEHPGIPITVSAGDSGYGVSYPAASPDVISVGGTALTKNAGSTRGWSEAVWRGSGGGCSQYETAKPKGQTSTGCSHRIDNDVAAVAAPETPVSIYDSDGFPGWELVGGTSVASPIVAGVEALSTSAFRTEGPEAFYKASQGTFFDVAAGRNGYCAPPSEDEGLCTAELGYDGPTGNGTPNLELSKAASVVTGAATVLKTHEGSTEAELAKEQVKLTGSVNPKGLETHYRFEYGTTTAYGKSVPATEGSAGSGTTSQIVAQTVLGLERETTYHYRLVATNSSGTIDGEDQTFTTQEQWTFESEVNEGSVHSKNIRGVTCLSTKFCVKVGLYFNTESSAWQPLAETWNGSEWSLHNPPQPTGAIASELFTVSCSSTTACTTVGDYVNSSGTPVTLAERWNGTEWTKQTTPNEAEAGSNVLFGVSCSSSTACTAVGLYVTHYEEKDEDWYSLAEQWNGTEWLIRKTPAPTGSTGSQLLSVACSSSTSCTAVGSFWHEAGYTFGAPTLLAEHWNGSEWSLQLDSNPTGATESELGGVSCWATNECRAAGAELEGTKAVYPLGESLSGSSWSHNYVGTLGGVGAHLNSISCTSSTECTAVGFYRPNGEGTQAEAPYTLRLNGEGLWARLSTPASLSGTGTLRNVTCESSTFCWAAGNGLMERYIPSPPAATTEAASGETLTGTVDPKGSETDYYFEYGKTTAYGASIPVSGVSAGSGESNVKVSESPGGLEPDTKYHFRLVATNGTSTTYGADKELLSSEAEWRQGGAKLSEAASAKWKGTIKLVDEGKNSVECEGTAEGSVGAGAIDEETKWTTSKCTIISGPCETPATLRAVNLPWHSEVVISEGTTHDLLTGSGKTTAGYKLECEVGGIVKTEDECTATTLKTGMTNVTGGVDAAFDGEKLNCTAGGTGKGSLTGTQLVEPTKGGKLEVTAPEWRQGGAGLTEAVAAKWKGTVKLVDEGKNSEECEGTTEGSVEIGGLDEETKWTTSKCTIISSESCEAPSTLTAVHLPWHSELTFAGGASYDVLTGSGKTTAGYKLECEVGGIVKTVDECTATTLKTGMTNVTGGVDAAFDGEKLNCTAGGSGKGSLTGTQLVEATKGGKLETTS